MGKKAKNIAGSISRNTIGAVKMIAANPTDPMAYMNAGTVGATGGLVNNQDLKNLVSPKPPKLPSVGGALTDPTAVAQQAAETAADTERNNIRRKNASSTLLTGGAGLLAPPTLAKKTLLGA